MIKKIFIFILISFSYYSVTSQTTGPTQPEAAGFAPIGADDMVNLYTGDFNYNIPLMVIPGPDGGYPINAFYNSNVGMDQAASWIGLGWNLNAGAIQRNLRGVPDDFKGDSIIKEFYTKPSTTISFDMAVPILSNEVIGADLSIGVTSGFSVYYNNYSGLGINTSTGTTLSFYDTDINQDGFSAGLGVSFGSQEGFSLSPNLSYDSKNTKITDIAEKGIKRSLALGFNINSKQGFSDLNLSFNNKLNQIATTKEGKSGTNSWSNNLSFASSSPLSSIKSTRFGTTGKFSFKVDPKKLGFVFTKEKIGFTGSLSRSWVTGKKKDVSVFGAMYLANKNDEKAITDFYRENEGPITKDNVLTPIPILSYDIFSIQGHGVGGSFRAYQNSIGKLSDPLNKSKSISLGLGFEAGLGTGAFKAGFDVSGSIAGSNSGPWKNSDYYFNELENYKFNTKTLSKPLFEPFYFKMIGEASAMDLNVWDEFEAENPIAFDINRRWDWSILAAKAQAHSSYNRSGNIFEGKENEGRNPRTQNIEYFTKKDIQSVCTTPHIVSNTQLKPIDYKNGEEHHLNGISVLKSNGVRYNYFLPAYNHSTEKVTFAIPGNAKFLKGRYFSKESNPKVIDKVLGKHGIRDVEFYAKVNNEAGEDEFYSKEIIPAYAHTFFITSILSQDYVDIDNNGPTSNDLGTYVKMNYEKVEKYKWRFPFKGAYYSKGYLDNLEDDKASYQEGEKDLFYVKSIETKTHVAVFETKDSELVDVSGSVPQKQLVSITLYSKEDPNWTPQFYLNPSASNNPTPIQTVYLNQDYSLKKGIPNTTGNEMAPALKELYFTYQNSTKGENAKYQFNYGFNLPYEEHMQDRWGAYQVDEGNIKVNENPYTYQSENYSKRDDEASAWLLDKITLPSKGSIEVDYEKDDYAYVQDKKATSFFKILGTGDKVYSNASEISRTQLNKDDKYLYFEAQEELNNEIIDKYFEGLTNIRFRVFMDLKKIPEKSELANDYVEGYAKTANKNWGYIPNTNIGYFEIEFVKPKNTSTYRLHPFRLATFQYIRKSRPDLGVQYDGIENADPVVFFGKNIASMLDEATTMITGYYAKANMKRWAMNLNINKPSYIRLVNPKRKYGGGSRVSKITLKSDETGAREFGQTYDYTLLDGRSSGVAEWEPILGIEENSFTQPIWLNANNDGQKIIFSNEQSFSEEPLGAGLYPSASVGYSRVTVRNLENENVTFAQSGINVSEFFTAKDFPTKADRSGALFAPYWAPVPIPFIGEQNTRYNGYSMGYSFTLNNAIYGRPKSVATYPYTEDQLSGEPIQKSVYKYKTLANDSKSLDNKVTTLLKEGNKKDVYMGKEIDFYIDEIEANTYSIGLGAQFNVDVQFPAFLPTWFPKINTGRKGTRYLTTNKIVYNTPILDSIIQYKDGAKVSTKNLVFDHETGEPIITSVTNEWKKPIYTYNFPAHWSYEQMKGAYKNYKAVLSIVSESYTNQSVFKLKKGLTSLGAIPLNLLYDGDELIFNFDTNTTYYVSNIDYLNNTFNLNKRDGLSAPYMTPGGITFPTALITKSGFKNLQSTKKGKIVSLEDLSSYQQTSLYNQLIHKLTNGESILKMNFESDCMKGYKLMFYPDDRSGSNFNFTFINYNNESICDGVLSIFFPSLPTNAIFNSISATSADLNEKYSFSTSVSGNSIDVKVIDQASQYYGKTYKGILSFNSNLESINNEGYSILGNEIGSIESCRCPITILHADATEFSDDWDFNYSELEDQSTDLTSSLTDIANNPSLGNPYAFGLNGIWRPKRTSAYLIDRLQSGNFGEKLRLDKDGEYKEFYWFDWTQPIEYNEGYNWRWVNEVTKYNVNGASKEGKNRLDIHAASLFGYNNHLVTASASNSKTTDIAFDGFEDYKPLQTGVEGDLEYMISNVKGGNLGFSQIGNSSSTNNTLWKSGHTGDYSFNISAEVSESPSKYWNYVVNSYTSEDKFIPKEDEKYYISFWTRAYPNKNQDRIPSTSEVDTYIPRTKIEAFSDNTSIGSFTVEKTTNPIDGWYKVEGTFTTLQNYQQFELRIYTLSDRIHVIDDIRIQPFNSGMETYVYDPTNYRLRATLSNQNFATFYNYDEEGNLTQTKVETERGIKTISSNRNNIKQ